MNFHSLVLVPWRMYRRTFNFRTIVHQKLVEFSVFVIRAQRQFHVFYLRVGGINPDGEKLQFACYFCAAFDEIFLLCSSPRRHHQGEPAAMLSLFQMFRGFRFFRFCKAKTSNTFSVSVTLCLPSFLCPDAKRPQLPNGNYGLMSPLFHSMSCTRNRGISVPKSSPPP